MFLSVEILALADDIKWLIFKYTAFLKRGNNNCFCARI